MTTQPFPRFTPKNIRKHLDAREIKLLEGLAEKQKLRRHIAALVMCAGHAVSLYEFAPHTRR